MPRFAAILCVTALMAAGLAAVIAPTVAQPPAPQIRADDPQLKPRSETIRMFMRAKLDHAQEVLRGLTIEDYDRIAREAQAMSLLSLESNWQVLQTEEYVAQSAEFRRAADALTRAGRQRDLNAATVAYLDLTVKCVNCHNYLRRHSGTQPAAAPRSGTAAPQTGTAAPQSGTAAPN